MDTDNKLYPGLQFPASELSAFAVCIDLFIISLKDGEIIRFTPDNVQVFNDWLISNGVRDVWSQLKEEDEIPTAPSGPCNHMCNKIFRK